MADIERSASGEQFFDALLPKKLLHYRVQSLPSALLASALHYLRQQFRVDVDRRAHHFTSSTLDALIIHIRFALRSDAGAELLHYLQKPVEHVYIIQRPRRRLRVILDR